MKAKIPCTKVEKEGHCKPNAEYLFLISIHTYKLNPLSSKLINSIMHMQQIEGQHISAC